MTTSAARAGAIYTVGNLLSAGVPFLLLPLLTRVLPPAEYGAVVNYFLLVSACTAFAGLGVQGALGVSWFKEHPQDMPRLVGAAIVVALLSTLLVAFVLTALAALLFPHQFGFDPWVAGLAAISAGSNVLLQCRLVLWQSQHRPAANAALQFASSALNVALSLIGVLVLGWGGMGRIAGATVAAVAVGALAVIMLRAAGEAVYELRKQHVQGLIMYGVPLIPHVLAGVMLATADRFVVSALLGPEMLGIYGAAAQLGTVMAIFADGFVKAFNPWLFARLSSQQPDEELRVVGAMYAAVPGFLAVAIAVGAALVAVGTLVLGPAYHSALSILPWFILGGAFSGVYASVAGLYFFGNRTGVLSGVSFPTASLGLLCTIGLVSSFGPAGGAMGYALSQALLALVAWIVAQRTFKLPWHSPRLALVAWWQQALAGHASR
ncbi:polysaccharide biosynthesis protein [Steroidobacter agaridevorans]|uniref:Polysaccharide biosynthesis protein n=1 Tax=Steroidobacter agaridevorans TaxID=2695856 RepID=A0A829YFE9_9GAMM|nr:lipopolysaccharide biosynthesis protein [Steroidobacter agaridevorans]GFE82019.1 polysaccharide biosynthesis protein [Steroidobacter agaridevorans]GFE85592.1 polysaccharide biosynthesis protein [Steroidobacter agaridevorans]